MKRSPRYPFRACCRMALVFLAFPALGAAQQPGMAPKPPQPRGQTERPPAPQHEMIAGKVFNARDGRPLPHATVTLFQEGAPNQSERTVASTQAGNDGSFHFDPVPPGRYDLLGQAPGYLAAHLWQHEQFWSAVVIGKGLPTTALDLHLIPEATIAGRVLDGTGDPVAQAQITLYHASSDTSAGRVQPFTSSRTEEDGRYSFDTLPPGRYFLSAEGAPWYAVTPEIDVENANVPYRIDVDPALDVAYPRVFYPHALRSEEASPLDLHGGETITADLQMVAEHAVTLTLPRATGNAANQFFPQLTTSVFGEAQTVSIRSTMTAMGTMRLTGIAPGQYDLFTTANGLLGSGVHVDLSSGSRTLDLPASQPLASVSVSVRTFGDRPLPANLNVALLESLGQRSLGGKYTGKGVGEGVVTFEQVPPGDYHLQTFAEGGPVPAISVQVEGRPVPGKEIHVTGDAPLHVRATLALQHIRIDGFAQQDGRPAASCMLELVPASGDTSEDLFRLDQSNLDGSFTFFNIVPGNYILIAIDNGWSLPWADVAAMTPYLLHGIPVSIAAEGPPTIALPAPVIAQPR